MSDATVVSDAITSSIHSYIYADLCVLCNLHLTSYLSFKSSTTASFFNMYKRKDIDSEDDCLVIAEDTSPKKFPHAPLSQTRENLVAAIKHGCIPAAIYYVTIIEDYEIHSTAKTACAKTRLNNLLICAFFQLIGPSGASLWLPLSHYMLGITNVRLKTRLSYLKNIIIILCNAPKDDSLEKTYHLARWQSTNNQPLLQNPSLDLIQAIKNKSTDAYFWCLLALQHNDACVLWPLLHNINPALAVLTSRWHKPLRNSTAAYLPFFMFIGCVIN